MSFRFNRVTGLVLGLLVGVSWMLLNVALATRFFTLPTRPEGVPLITLAGAVPASLGVLGFFLGSRWEAQEHARPAERQALEFETLLNHVSEAILIVDADQCVRLLTPAYERLLGVASGDIVGRTLSRLTRSVTLSRVDGSSLLPDETPISRALRGEKVTNETVVMEYRGRKVELLTDAHPIRDKATGRVVMAIASSRNVADLRQLDRLKDEFIATASHELRTPITLIRALAQLTLLDLDTRKAPEAAGNLKGIINQADRVTHLVNQMLDASRIDTGKLLLRLQAVQLPALLEQELERLRITHPSHALVLDTTEARRPWGTVTLDAEKILQVVANLVDNAVKYSPKGSTVTLGVRETQEGSEVWVSDEGMGVPPEDRETIFAKFYRSSNAVNCDDSGLGLGLYVSRRLVELHGGRIWLDRRPGPGSTFRFFLPRARVAAPPVAG